MTSWVEGRSIYLSIYLSIYYLSIIYLFLGATVGIFSWSPGNKIDCIFCVCVYKYIATNETCLLTGIMFLNKLEENSSMKIHL